LITLVLCAEGVLRQPLLYLSLYFKNNRSRYYDLLQRIRSDGDWEEWLTFFAIGVAETAETAVVTASRIADLFAEDRISVEEAGRAAGSALRVYQTMQRRPVVSIARIAGETGLSKPATASALGLLENRSICREITGKKRNRLYAYTRYLEILSEGVESEPG
jgi:Fic family protein